MARPARAIIHLDAIQHNYRLAKACAPNSRALAVIKANAYGHGAVRIAQHLAPEADGFAVACIEEALELRAAGIQNRIVLLEGVFTPDELSTVAEQQLTIVVQGEEQLAWLLEARIAQKLEVFLKIDSGMHRLGFAPEQVKQVYQRLRACAHVGDLVCMTHFARADETQLPRTSEQYQIFQRATQGLNASCSLANSPAILAWPAMHHDWVRPGIMLYGASPLDHENAHSLQLQPAMSLESALIAIRSLPAGEPIGYGGRFVTDKPTQVGVVAMGYADGYPRHAVDGTPVAVNGQRTRVIGRVSMDMMMIDVTGLEIKLGDRVELWGKMISANEVAAHSSTIAYTLFTGITRRVPLIYQT
ncbi:alanine racemase [Thiolinea disciformis]|uniref:alanine racemase n=1 Tax=Thiolinea disciformis TaxID=125614 RepID=UPI00036F7E09|nr:alanine racemase [Thiolinea disciformis]